MIHKIILSLFGMAAGVTFGQIPAGYYNGTANLTGAALKTKLSQIITNGHQDKGYSGLWNAYATTDRDFYYENDGTILDMYSEKPTATDSYSYTLFADQCGGGYSKEGDCYNREHVVPQSLFNENYPMRSDVHFIRATDGYVNGVRSNYPFGKVGSVTFTSTNGSKLGTSASAGYSGVVFEPIDEFKGDIARMAFYFVTRYESQLGSFSSGNILGGSAYPGLQNWEKEVLLAWHAQDPVSAAEIARNNASYAFQGNRNPYIDNPQWVTAVWNPAALAVNETKAESKIAVYPNPVSGGYFMLHLSENRPVPVKILDLSGKVVAVHKVSAQQPRVEVGSLPAGEYIVLVENSTHKIIIK